MKSGIYEEDNIHPENQPGFITISIQVNSEIYINTTEVKINPQIPFSQFANIIKDMAFSQVHEKQFLMDITFIKRNQQYSAYEKRTLEQLGFQNDDILQVRLRLKGGQLVLNYYL